MTTPNRSPESVEKRREYARNYARERVAERVEYNRGWITDNPEKVSSYRRKSRDKGESKFASGERERALEKKCSLCKQAKVAADFYLSNISKDGLHGWCKECSDRKTRENTRKRMFGISPEDFAEILEAQGGGCAICKTKDNGKRAFCVDHDHKTGKVRGILCHRCNIMIGSVDDDIEILKQSISYLEGRGQ